uniref:Uncharacterized protein n=1 Tax=Anguilla anguilla TaxID=7936 RepID=A0A0E9QR85_ANGAN
MFLIGLEGLRSSTSCKLLRQLRCEGQMTSRSS